MAETATATTEAPQWTSKIVAHSKADPNTLVANPLNWRAHPRNQQKAIDAAIDDVGFWRSVTVNRNSGTIIDGHLRVARAIATQQQAIDVEWVDMTDDEERKALLSADSIAGMAETNRANLDQLLRGVEAATTNMQDFLADLAKRNGLYLNTLEPTRPDPGPLVNEPQRLMMKWGTQRNQVWLIPSRTVLGNVHRLLIGDSTIEANVRRLMGHERADMVWTDPPYGVAYVGKTSDALTIGNDQIDDGHTYRLVRDAARAWPLKPGGSWYVCSPGGYTESEFRNALKEAGEPLHQSLVWIKDHFVMGRQDYHWRHETILYGWRPGAAHYFIPQRIHDTILLDEQGPELKRLSKDELVQRLQDLYRGMQETTWREERPSASRMHPTTKPVELAVKAIRNSTAEKGAIVYDGFVGYGGAIVACEQEGRQARVMELAPEYAAATLERLTMLGLNPTIETE